MKYIFLFVNPTAGGNRASMFTDVRPACGMRACSSACTYTWAEHVPLGCASSPRYHFTASPLHRVTSSPLPHFPTSPPSQFGVNEIIFHKPHKCHFSIYNILEGEQGKKPGFLRLSSVTNSPREAEVKNESVAPKSRGPVSKSSLSVEGRSGTPNRNPSNNSSVNGAKEPSNSTGSGGNTKGEDHPSNGTKQRNNSQKTCSNNSEGTAGDDENIFAYVLVAGGDGTLNWFLKEAEHYDIKDDKIAVGVIPFGTGNDFAKAFGWKKMDGFFNYSFLFNILKKIVDQTFKSRIEKHDYWNVHVVLKEDGYFNKISSRTKKKETLTENEKNVKVLKMCMSNYFSIGIDSRIGRGFERHRQNSAFFNKLIYVIEGFKKIIFKKNIPVNLIIDKMVTGKNYDDVIFTTSHNDSTSPPPPLLKKAMSIICVNIPSYSSGNDIWNYTHKIGLKLPKDLPSEQKKVYKDLKKSQQEVGDGVLEFVIYQSGVDLGLEFTLRGRAFRVHQGVGPWKILFKEQVCNVYFQVDGEYYLMSLPDSISIDHYKKINVLKNMV